MFPKHTNSMENCVSSKQLLVGNLSGPQNTYYYIGSRAASPLGPFAVRLQDTLEADTLLSESV